jgi:hypothetical protein
MGEKIRKKLHSEITLDGELLSEINSWINTSCDELVIIYSNPRWAHEFHSQTSGTCTSSEDFETLVSDGIIFISARIAFIELFGKDKRILNIEIHWCDAKQQIRTAVSKEPFEQKAAFGLDKEWEKRFRRHRSGQDWRDEIEIQKDLLKYPSSISLAVRPKDIIGITRTEGFQFNTLTPGLGPIGFNQFNEISDRLVEERRRFAEGFKESFHKWPNEILPKFPGEPPPFNEDDRKMSFEELGRFATKLLRSIEAAPVELSELISTEKVRVQSSETEITLEKSEIQSGETAKKQKPTVPASAIKSMERITIPPDFDLTDLIIKFTAGDMCQFISKYGEWQINKIRSFIQMGFENTRKKGTPIKVWNSVLRKLAQGNGKLPYTENDRFLPQEIEETNTRLKEFLGIDYNPIQLDQKERCYRSRFKISYTE